jgi:vacuolar-type H+-ATPase subunit E/Vma4
MDESSRDKTVELIQEILDECDSTDLSEVERKTNQIVGQCRWLNNGDKEIHIEVQRWLVDELRKTTDERLQKVESDDPGPMIQRLFRSTLQKWIKREVHKCLRRQEFTTAESVHRGRVFPGEEWPDSGFDQF